METPIRYCRNRAMRNSELEQIVAIAPRYTENSNDMINYKKNLVFIELTLFKDTTKKRNQAEFNFPTKNVQTIFKKKNQVFKKLFNCF